MFAFADWYESDDYFGRILLDIQSGLSREFTLHDRFIFRGDRLCILDCSLCLQLISETHNEGQIGRDQTLHLISQSYFWSALRRDVERFVERCTTCQSQKAMLRTPVSTFLSLY